MIFKLLLPVIIGLITTDFVPAEYFELLLNDTDLSQYNVDTLWNKLKDELGLYHIHTPTVKKYPIVLDPDLVLSVCLKGTRLLRTLRSNSACLRDDYDCRFGSLVNNGSTVKIESLVGKLDDKELRTNVKLGIRDCSAWRELLRKRKPKADLQQQFGNCLFHITCRSCHSPVEQLVKVALE